MLADVSIAIEKAYNLLATTVEPEEFLSGFGNWGLTKQESNVARLLAQALVEADKAAY